MSRFKLIFIFILFISLNAKNVDLISLIDNLKQIENKIAVTNDEDNISKLIKQKDTILNEFIIAVKTPSIKLDVKIDKKRLEFLNQRILINSSRNNTVAVYRDKLEIYDITQQKLFFKYLNEVRSLYKKQASSKIEDISEDFIKKINFDISKIESIAKKLNRNSSNSVIIDFFKNLDNFNSNNSLYTEIASYFIQNSERFVNNNFLLKMLNANFIISKIDSLPIIYDINLFLDYNFNIKLGKIIFALIIIFSVFGITNYTIPYIIKILQLKFIKFDTRSEQEYFFKKLILKPLKLLLWIFAINTSLDITLDKNIVDTYANIAYIIVVWYFFYNLLNNVVSLFYDRLNKKKNLKIEMINLLITASKILISIIAFLFGLKQFGYDISAILASLGVGGLALALAAKDTLTNLFGSISIIFDDSFSQGDWIETDDIEGTVIDIGIRTTTIRTFANAYLTVPNSYLANTSITNWSKREVGRRIKLKIGVTYDSKKDDLQNAVKEIREYLMNNEDIAYNCKISNENVKKKSYKFIKQEDFIGIKDTLLVYVDEYDSSSINILVYCFSKTTNWEEWLKVKEKVLYKIWDILENNNLEFAYPTQRVLLDENKS